MLDGVSSGALDLVLTGGSIADVRAGSVRRAAVGIADRTIARIGPDDEVAPHARQTIDVSGQVIVPGYIEPHGHILLANPVEFAGALLRTGTTTAIVDAPGPLAGIACIPIRLADEIPLVDPTATPILYRNR